MKITNIKKCKLILICIILLMNSFVSVLSYDETMIDTLDSLYVIDKTRVEDKTVSRGRCVAIVCRATGRDNDMLWRYSIGYMPYKLPFDDVDNMLNYCGPAIYFAYDHGIVTKGEDDMFEPERDTTYGEAVSFILRTIEKADNLTLEQCYERAKEIELLREEDSFYNSPNELITYYDLCVLINRMIRYNSYIDVENSSDINNSEKDFTYYEALIKRKTKIDLLNFYY